MGFRSSMKKTVPFEVCGALLARGSADLPCTNNIYKVINMVFREANLILYS